MSLLVGRTPPRIELMSDLDHGLRRVFAIVSPTADAGFEAEAFGRQSRRPGKKEPPRDSPWTSAKFEHVVI